MMHLVLGRGFIGTAIARRLEGSGASLQLFSSRECDLREGASVGCLKQRIGAAAVDGLIVCASRVRLKGNTFDTYCDNISIAVNVARLVSELRPRKAIFFSTVDVYGDHPALPITPASALRPFDHYGRSKLLSECILVAACESERIPFTVFRLAGVFGPTDRGNSAISKLVDLCRAAQEIQVSNAGRTLRDYVFVDDLARLTQEALASDYYGTFNAVSGQSLTVLEIVETIVREFHSRSRVVVNEAKSPRDYDLVFDQAGFNGTFSVVKFTTLADALPAYGVADAA